MKISDEELHDLVEYLTKQADTYDYLADWCEPGSEDAVSDRFMCCRYRRAATLVQEACLLRALITEKADKLTRIQNMPNCGPLLMSIAQDLRQILESEQEVA